MRVLLSAWGRSKNHSKQTGKDFGIKPTHHLTSLCAALVRRSRMSCARRLPEVNVNAVASTSYPTPPPILDDICMPPYAGDGWFLQNDFGVLARIVQHFRPRIVFEYGTAHGNTAANICQLSDAQIYTLNALPEQISGSSVTFTLTSDEIGRVYRAKGFTERVTQIYENSLTFTPETWLKEKSVDLCIIDACHDAPYVTNDFLKIVPFMTPRGIVLLHDTHPSRQGHLRGSYDACCMLRRRGFNVQHIEDTWWGYWRAD
jgi:hypothetical protein